MLHPQEMPSTQVGNENRMGIPPGPSIKNYEVWLTWQACFLDTSHWWGELTAIPDVEDLNRLAQKIHTSFLIPVVRCETLQNQDYTTSPAPKCLSRNRFLPNDPTYQDVHWQPLLLTLAYAQALQYWAEKVSPPMPGGYHPLVMSVVQLRWREEGHFTFSKQNILCNLGGTVPEARSQDMEALQEGAIAPPTNTTIGGVEPCPTKTQGADNIILASPRCTPNNESPPAEPTTPPAEINLPGSAEISPRGSTIMSLARIDTDTPKDLVTFGLLVLLRQRVRLFPPLDKWTS